MSKPQTYLNKVFGQRPHNSIFLGAYSTSVNEEDVQERMMPRKMEVILVTIQKLIMSSIHHTKSVLAIMLKHLHLHQEADKHYRTNVKRMQLKYFKVKNKKVLTFCPGYYVSVHIPDQVQIHIVYQCVVVKQYGSKLYLYTLQYCQVNIS